MSMSQEHLTTGNRRFDSTKGKNEGPDNIEADLDAKLAAWDYLGFFNISNLPVLMK